MILIMSSFFECPDSPPGTLHSLGVGHHLFRLGDPVNAMYAVIEGEIALERVSKEGARLVLQRAGPGMLLAEASLFAQHYHCDAVARKPSRVRSVAISAVRAHFLRNPEALWAFTRHLAHEVQRGRLRAEMLSMRRLADRLNAWLLLQDGTMPPKGGRRLLAAELGVTPEALYRELARRR